MIFKIQIRTLATNFPSRKEMVNAKNSVVYTFMPLNLLVKANNTNEAKKIAIEEAERLFPEKAKFFIAKCIEVFKSEEEAWQNLS